MPATNGQEVHIASCVIRVRAEALPAAMAEIGRLCDVEIVAQHPIGKLVAILEGTSTADLLARMDAIRACAAVLSVEMVYQHAESETNMKEILQ